MLFFEKKWLPPKAYSKPTQSYGYYMKKPSGKSRENEEKNTDNFIF